MKKEKSKKDEIIDKLLEENELTTTKDISNVLNDLFGNMVQRLLEAEMDTHLGYSKSSHETKENNNRRNGYSSKNKKIKTDKGEITVDMPRDRDGTFEPIIISKRQRVLKDMEELVISLYAKGMSQRDIKNVLKKIYKYNVSTTFIGQLISAVDEEVQVWQNRSLKSFYPIVYMDCLYVPIKDDLISKKMAIYVMVGIALDGKKEVIGIWIGEEESESATYWTIILEEIKSRGVEDVLFFCMDGLSGLREAISEVFPLSNTQRCIVHLCRNLKKICTQKEAKQVLSDFKKIYQSSSKEKAQLEYENFIAKYENRDKIIAKVKDYMEFILPLFDYPEEIRKLIYTTNAIESTNSSLRKVTKGKGSFPNKESVIKVMYLRVLDLEEKWKCGVKNWKTILNQLCILFEDRVTKYLDI